MTYMRQKTERFYLITVFLLPVLLSVQSCTCRFETMSALESVSSYISEEPDRALSDLDSIHASGIKGREAKAKYALLYSMALDKNNEVCGYKFVSLGKMTDFIKKGLTPNEAYEKSIGTYGRYTKEQGAVKHIDPRTDKEVD